ncbi:MAG: SDR family oxidoreductase [Caulobacter sp.]|nr:SDR family oxidoreductase [Caulobacter sp.]
MNSLFDVRDKVVLITGGSRGIGEMLARAFVDSGAVVLISSRKAEACQALADELSANGRCESLPFDLSTTAGIDGLVAAIDRRGGGLDVLINNAGATWGAPLESFPESGWDKTFDLNLKAPFFLTQKLLPALRRAVGADRPARVINIASIDGIAPPAFDSFAYSASKAGMLMLTRHMAKALAPENILVNAIAPGFFATRMTDATLEEIGEDVLRKTPLGRLGRPDDIGGVAIFLASRSSAFLTGATIPCDGGLSTAG